MIRWAGIAYIIVEIILTFYSSMMSTNLYGGDFDTTFGVYPWGAVLSSVFQSCIFGLLIIGFAEMIDLLQRLLDKKPQRQETNE